MSDDPDQAAEYAKAIEWFEADVPECWADTLNVSTSPYGNSITFGLRGPRGPVPKARVFMSHEMAHVLQLLLRRILATYELENSVAIQVPEHILASLRLRDEDFANLELGFGTQTAVTKGHEDDMENHGGR